MEALPFVAIDPPTVSMQFSINDGPLAGKEGKHVTSRAIRDRLMRELKTNISIQVEDTDLSGVFNVSARGAMQIAVLVEQMRREGFEVLVSRPVVIFRRDDAGKLLEPFETLYVEAPGDYTQGILKIMMNRKGVMEHMDTEPSGRTFIQAVIPTRGLIGFETELVNLTSGHGIMSHLFKEYGPHAGEIQNRTTGTLVSMDSGTATPYSLQMLEERGILFVAPGDAVYGGMLVGENPRVGDLPVNPVKEKHLDNMRSSGKDKTSKLTPRGPILARTRHRIHRHRRTRRSHAEKHPPAQARARCQRPQARRQGRHRRRPQQPRVSQGVSGPADDRAAVGSAEPQTRRSQGPERRNQRIKTGPQHARRASLEAQALHQRLVHPSRGQFFDDRRSHLQPPRPNRPDHRPGDFPADGIGS